MRMRMRRHNEERGWPFVGGCFGGLVGWWLSERHYSMYLDDVISCSSAISISFRFSLLLRQSAATRRSHLFIKQQQHFRHMTEESSQRASGARLVAVPPPQPPTDLIQSALHLPLESITRAHRGRKLRTTGQYVGAITGYWGQSRSSIYSYPLLC